MVKQKSSLVRPSCSVATNKVHQIEIEPEAKRRSILILSLLATCVFLFVLCACLVTALVLVGKNLSKPETSFGVRSKQLNSTQPLSRAYSNNSTPTRSGALDARHRLDLNNSLVSLDDVLPIKIPSYRNSESSEPSEHSEPSEVRLVERNENDEYNSAPPAMTIAASLASKVMEKLSFRLPREVRPLAYDLLLHPDLTEKTFSGRVSIDVVVSNPISFIAVHAKKLKISETSLLKRLANGTTENIRIANAFNFDPHEYWVTETHDPLEVGTYAIQMQFNGSLTDRIVGFYQSSYFDPIKNMTRRIATSKFEPTFARQAFPCFDEPEMKAKFKISLVRPTTGGYHALSNMDIEGEEKFDENNTLVKFNESVPMSTYLACFIVSDFAHKKRIIKPSVGEPFDLRVFATEAQIDKIEFPLDMAEQVTKYYIDYFQIAYPLPKLDMAAIPDFVSGAMEHWGLVTYRETSLLYDPAVSSTTNKQRVATVVAHELAHMWFGNLVTMKWWNDLWLNEGFASYIEYKGTAQVHPDWGMMEQFLIDDLHGVLTLDGTLASHPIVQTVSTPDQITELFDSITYNKGAAIIRMLEDMIGAENFQKSVQNYLKAHQFNNAVTQDLLDEIKKLQLDYDINGVMDTWTRQMGLPVIQVEMISSKMIKVTQKRFLSNPTSYELQPNDSPYNYKWSILLTYFTDKSEEKKTERSWFFSNSSDVSIVLPADAKWIKFNRDQIGYYRVNYAEDMWKELTAALTANINIMTPSDRAHLLNDAFSLAEATQTKYSIALDLTQYMVKEDHYVPWSVALSKLNGIRSKLYGTDVFEKIEKSGQNLIEQAYKNVTWDVDLKEHLKNRMRTSVLSFACNVNLPDCIKHVGEEFNKWLGNDTIRPSPDLRTIIYNYGMANFGTTENWEHVWQLFLSEQDATEKVKLMNALSSIENHALLTRFVNLAWDENNVRGQDYFSCLQNIADNRIGEPIVWKYVRENWPKLVARFSLNERNLGRMIPAITRRFNSKTQLNEMHAFFEEYPEAGAGTAARAQALDTVAANIKWLENNKNSIEQWFNK